MLIAGELDTSENMKLVSSTTLHAFQTFYKQSSFSGWIKGELLWCENLKAAEKKAAELYSLDGFLDPHFLKVSEVKA